MFMRLDTKAARLAARWVPKGYVPYTPAALDPAMGAIFTTPAGAPKAGAIGYRGTAGRPSFNYTFPSADRMLAYVDSFVAGLVASADRKATEKATKAAWVNTLTAGTILSTSWGYDQTNVDFFVVRSVSGRKVVVAKIASGETEATGFMSGKCRAADPVVVTGPDTVHIAQPAYGGGAAIRIDGHSATVWDGKDKYYSYYA